MVVNARRFAALFAGFDTGNACEAEALSKGRALRCIAAQLNMRIVDLLEVPEVRQAIDDQMHPARQGRRELEDAMEHAAALREELTERTRDVRNLAEMLARQKEVSKALREELAATCATTGPSPTQKTPPQNHAVSPARVFHDVSHSCGAQSWVFEIAVVIVAFILLCMAGFN